MNIFKRFIGFITGRTKKNQYLASILSQQAALRALEIAKLRAEEREALMKSLPKEFHDTMKHGHYYKAGEILINHIDGPKKMP